MPYYEHVVVTRPDISPQQVDSLVEEITGVVSEMEGSVQRTEYWGLRSLSYPIRKSRKAHYSMLNIDAPAGVVEELERRHRINEDVLRYLTVRVDELTEEPSAMMKKDRGDRGDRKRRDRDDDRGGRDRGPREDRGDRGERAERDNKEG